LPILIFFRAFGRQLSNYGGSIDMMLKSRPELDWEQFLLLEAI